MIQIKRNNKVFFTLEDFGEGSKLSYQLMDHHYVILKFTTATPIYFEIGDSVEIPDFGYFELTSSYFPKHNDSDGYDYEMQMDAYYMSWKNKLCKYRPQHGANETSFKLTTTVGVHMNVILGNLKALGLTYNGKDFSVDYTTYNNKAFDVQSLATALNTSSDAVMAAINGLGQQICNLGNQMGMNANQILTAIMQGNNAIATQLAECCCKTNNAITAMDGNIKLSICQQTHAINDTANANALMLRDKADANNQSVLAKLDQMQTQAMQDKLDALREKNGALLAQISNEHQTQALQAYQAQVITPVNAALAALQAEVAGIKCKLPNTISVQYPQYGVFNKDVYTAAAMGAYAGDVAASRSTVGCGC